MPNEIVNDLSSIPFDRMIGGPLSACIDAQEQAALSTVNFIDRVGFDPKNPGHVVNVDFTYKREGTDVQLSVPLLTIVPIPFISIDTVNISFKAALKSISSEDAVDVDRQSSYDSTNSRYLGVGSYLRTAEVQRTVMRGSVSTKKDSVATQNSVYSIEANVDINVIARQESMPGGLAKVLEMLNQAISIKENE
jgi:hypothetical protein